MKLAAMFKMILAMSIFGSIGFFTVKTGVPAIELVFVRCIFATIFLSLCWLLTGHHKVEVWNKRELLVTLICGIFLVLNWVFLFKAFEQMSITISISIYHLAPIFVLILGSLVLKERMNIMSLIAIVVCFLGSILVVGTNGYSSLTDLVNSGFIWALLAAICYAMTMLLGKGINQLSAYAMTFVQTFIGIIILFPFIDLSKFDNLTFFNWLFILGTGFIHTGLVYYLFFDSLRKLPTSVISALVFLDPAVAILLDIIIVGFRPSLMQIIDILLIFSGMVYTLVKPKKNGKYETIEGNLNP
ncbi:transporter [Peribacillus loiseleuriae]|uniref:Transporter n=1 Tax=Peribacillus loiseleuriae TaxID=1679170 RepID=A0A0K9GQ19_9BACI|nr:transporter [Peribacillus loiseleuriae]